MMLHTPVIIRFFAVLAVFTVLACAVPAAARQSGAFATVIIQVRPSGSEIFIDGVKWAGSDPAAPLSVQLAPGTHRVEVSAPGRQTFVREITLKAGETLPLNVSLTSSDAPSSTPRPTVTPQPAGQQPPPTPRPRVPGPPQPQPRPAPTAPGQNIQVVPNEDGFVFAPDVRITQINDEPGTWIGAYGGMAFGGKLLVGAGAYFQVDGYNGRQMNYFGPVFEYRMLETKTIGVNFHSLIGGGIEYGTGGCCFPIYGPYYGPYPYYNEGFFVFEPEVQLVVRFSPNVRFQAGLGYRVTSGYNHDGVSGSFSLQIGK